jgi:hypothetical protein
MSYTVPQSSVIDYPPEAMETFHVHCHEWIDNLHFILSPQQFVVDSSKYVAVARQRFLDAGWEGDGEIGLLWIPPFVFPLELGVPPVGLVLWHVKQIEEGLSWLLSPIELPFNRFCIWI